MLRLASVLGFLGRPSAYIGGMKYAAHEYMCAVVDVVFVGAAAESKCRHCLLWDAEEICFQGPCIIGTNEHQFEFKVEYGKDAYKWERQVDTTSMIELTVLPQYRYATHGRAFSDSAEVAFQEFCDHNPPKDKKIKEKDAEKKDKPKKHSFAEKFAKKHGKNNKWLAVVNHDSSIM